MVTGQSLRAMDCLGGNHNFGDSASAVAAAAIQSAASLIASIAGD
jgi:hypothetical protein